MTSVLRRTALRALAIASAASVAAGVAAAPAIAGRPADAGPPYHYTTALMGQHAVIPLKNQAMITTTKHGYVYRAGQQDSHLVITLANDGLHLTDTGTSKFKRLAGVCDEERAATGVAAVCPLPDWVTTARPLLLEVWPRLGDDFVDGSSLPATVDMTVLADEGNDTALLGAGDDFFNGHLGRDRVWGGDGNDWIRTGGGNDTFWGGAGDDYLIGMEGADEIWGGPGVDRLGGMSGADVLHADDDADETDHSGDAGGSRGRAARGLLTGDRVLCGTGRDTATVDDTDFVLLCNSVTRTP